MCRVNSLYVSHLSFCTDLSCSLSIVAVHGLGATPDWAWIRKVEDGNRVVHVNWLKDTNMLPAKLPDSRIMVFNYESKWLLNAPRQSRSPCAEQMLTALDNKRREVTVPSSHRFSNGPNH